MGKRWNHRIPEKSVAVREIPIEVSCQEVKQALETSETFLLIDCREADEYQTVCIDAATLLPMSQLAERAHELEGKQSERIVVHCHHGQRSLQVVNWLRQQGFLQSQSMAGGIDVWAQEIEPGMLRY